MKQRDKLVSVEFREKVEIWFPIEEVDARS
jgi:hypothetical protein